MAIQNADELIERAVILLGSTGASIPPAAQEEAAKLVLSETGWSYPITSNTISFWAIERMKRHLLQVAATEAAMKFQYKQIHLEHRFKHLSQLIETMDKAFLKFAEENPEFFPNLDESEFSDFASVISSGFTYDIVGDPT